MNSFSYYKPQTLEQAFELLDQYNSRARLMAGGTDLIVRLKNDQIEPEAVIDIKAITELNSGVVMDGGWIRIGALTLMTDLQNDELINEHLSALAEAAADVGSVQIRNRATLAGNLCNASPAADTAPSQLIYDAQVELASKKGIRTLPLADFITGPGKTALLPGEIVKSIQMPVPSGKQAASFERLTRRKGVDLATVNLCCQVKENGTIRFAVGAAGPVPFIVSDTSGKLADRKPGEVEKTELINALMQSAAPITDVRASKEYRQEMLGVLGYRALVKTLEKLDQK